MSNTLFQVNNSIVTNSAVLNALSNPNSVGSAPTATYAGKATANLALAQSGALYVPVTVTVNNVVVQAVLPSTAIVNSASFTNTVALTSSTLQLIGSLTPATSLTAGQAAPTSPVSLTGATSAVTTVNTTAVATGSATQTPAAYYLYALASAAQSASVPIPTTVGVYYILAGTV